ncbi:MAG: von Willebrand factor [Pedosphaera sp.]|nr:von Willebrand factor [Pedosphaera sp.]
MKPNSDDPRLTAYALGELDEATRKEIESQLAASEADRLEVEETTKLAEMLTRELRTEPMPALNSNQVAAIEAKIEEKPEGPRASFSEWLALQFNLLNPKLSIFATLLVVIGIIIVFAGLLLPSLSKAKLTAKKRSFRYAELETLALGKNSASRSSEGDFSAPKEPGFITPTISVTITNGYQFETAQQNTATYPQLRENSFAGVLQHPLSTFSIDVDTASYANVRRFLTAGQLPPHEAVRLEEMINYFSYQYPQPRGEDPFSANIEVAGCPWNGEHRLVRIGLKGREIVQDKRPPSNFVFLIDVSGSMEPAERLPLIKQALRQMVKKMTASDRVAIVVYASEAGIKLASTSCAQKEKILQAIDELGAGGSTNGGEGIQGAYRVAQENYIKGGVNRVILCTDGDFNVGMTDQSQLVQTIQEKAKSGVFLTTLGVGTDNYKDALMQMLADKGNGNYYYLDTIEEAQKVLIDQMNGTLVTIAKDVKIQVEFNPKQVSAYRLIGYEKRMLRKEDFNNDAKDAGEIGAGHTVTALYEIVPAGTEFHGAVDDLKYQSPTTKPERYVSTGSKELLTLKLRYKQPDGDKSKLLEFPCTDGGASFGKASTDFKFAAAVASFGMILRDSEFKGSSSYGAVLELAEEAKGTDEAGYRSEFLNLVRKAQALQR